MVFVIPGDMISDKPEHFKKGTAYIKDGKTYAAVVGTLEEGKFTSLESVYIPMQDDPIVGIVIDERHGNYTVDANIAFPVLILAKNIGRARFKLGDFISAKIYRIEGDGTVILGNVRLLKGGKVIDVPSAKVPRIIGKKGSMLSLIKEKTGVEMFVGANGYIWIGDRGKITKAIKAIKTIVAKAHLTGLTDEISKMLESG
ncbi:MAG: KH domain-containing protein [Candidatus Anstonellales archaeon]